MECALFLAFDWSSLAAEAVNRDDDVEPNSQVAKLV